MANIDAINSELDTNIFSLQDIAFMKCQLSSNEFHCWSNLSIDKKMIISDAIFDQELDKHGWDGYRDNYKTKGIYDSLIMVLIRDFS